MKFTIWSLNDLAALGDIAQSVISEVHLRLSARILSDKNDALRRMISGASHDVRNQLGVITMYAALLNEDETSEDERRNFTEEIRESAKQATRLISDLLGSVQDPAGTAASSHPPDSLAARTPNRHGVSSRRSQKTDPDS